MQLISFVGVDTRTDLDDVIALAHECHPIYPEFGVLYSASRAGKQNRYPAYKDCVQILEDLTEEIVMTSIHLCGQEAINGYLNKHDDIMELVQFGRVQLNFAMKDFGDPRDLLGRILEVAQVSHIDNVIVQSNKSKKAFIDVVLDMKDNLENKVDILYDGSGGFGRVIETFLPPYEGFLTGYAGGINPSNVRSIDDAVKAVVGENPYYLDMESGIRENDLFSVKLCREVINNLK